MNNALIVIDMQLDFMLGGPLSVVGAEEIIGPIMDIIPKYETVVFTQDWHPKGHKSFASSHEGKQPFDIIRLHGQPQTLWPDHCIAGKNGSRIHPALQSSVDMAHVILRKGMDKEVDSYSAFYENHGPKGRKSTGLLGLLAERVVRSVTLVGLARDYCVKWSAQDIGMTIPTRVLWNLTRPVNPANDEQTRQDIRRVGVTVE